MTSVARWPVYVAALLVAGCSGVTPFRDDQGRAGLVIVCGAATSASVCHSRARKECLGEYVTVAEDWGINRKELRVRCGKP